MAGLTRQQTPRQLLRASARWGAGIVAALALTTVVSAVAKVAWSALRRGVGAPVGIAIVVAAVGGLSFLLAARAGAFGDTLLRVWLRAAFEVRMLPYRARELCLRGRPATARGNRVYESLAAYESEDSRRQGRPQLDFGIGWRDRDRRGGLRVTWIQQTGELIAVEADDPGPGRVELVAVIDSRTDVHHVMRDWEYAAFGDGSLKWVRRRAHGWPVPLSPTARWWQIEDAKPPPPLPAPPPPSTGRSGGAYIGYRDSNRALVDIVLGSERRPLHHYVEASVAGFGWGYGGGGPDELARSLLADRLGYSPQPEVCSTFCSEVVAHLPSDAFVLTFAEVDAWIDSHTVAFAANPRAHVSDRVDP